MEPITSITIITTIIILTALCIITAFTFLIKYETYNKKLKKELKELKEAKIKKESNELNIQDTEAYFDFFNKLLTLKFSYYLNTFLIANFISNKELEKKEIKKLKTDFYLDVSKTLNDQQKQNLLKVFSQKGIELFIHQSFLRMLNDANIKFKDDTNQVNDRMLKTIYNQG